MNQLTTRHTSSLGILSRAVCASLVLLISACGGGDGDGPTVGPIGPGPGTTTKPGVFSISAMPRLNPFPATPTEVVNRYTEGFNLAFNAGARGQVTTYTWKELEPSNTAGFDAQKMSDLDGAIANAANRGMTQFVGIQVINTTNRELPSDLQAAAFDNAAVKARLRLLLDQVLKPANRGKIKYLSIGNEVDAYLRVHPAEWTTYKSLYEDALAYAHTLDPTIKVGVTATADQILVYSGQDLLNSLNALSDVIMLTYYPITSTVTGTTINVSVRSPTVPASDFPVLMTFAGTKPLVFQEVGYPAATANGSSEAMQAQFVTNVFSTWKNSNGKIPFLNYFLLHDFTQQMCVDFGTYYGLPNQVSFQSFLCSLGLRKDDGTPRQAWATLQAEITAAGLP